MCHASPSWAGTVGKDVLAALFMQFRHYRREFLQRGGNWVNKQRVGEVVFISSSIGTSISVILISKINDNKSANTHP
jgi:hypothetical protein